MVVLRRDRQVANTSPPAGECRGGWACKSLDGLHDKFDYLLMRGRMLMLTMVWAIRNYNQKLHFFSFYFNNSMILSDNTIMYASIS